MLARSNSVQADPAALDRLVHFVRDDLMDRFQEMPGFVGISVLVDRNEGRGITTTAWESLEAMRASEERAGTARKEALAMTGSDKVQVEEWEVSLLHRMHETGDGACARVVRAHGERGMEQALDAFRSMVLPALEGMPGFCSVSLLTDRADGRVVACTVYESREAMSANGGTAADLRERFGAATGMTVDDVATFEVAVAHLRVPETV